MESWIVRNSESSFTVTFNSTDNISTTLTASADEVDSWIAEILRVHRRRLDRLIVGLDCEWRPSFSRVQNPVALLQLCVGRRCLIFQLLYADEIPSSLLDFLNDDRFTFVGVGIKNDAERLYDERYLEVCNAVDLSEIAAEKMERPDLRRKGLADLAMEVVAVEVRKPKHVTMSRWDDYHLSLDQILYACIDAFLSFEIGRRLYDGYSCKILPNTSCLPNRHHSQITVKPSLYFLPTSRAAGDDRSLLTYKATEEGSENPIVNGRPLFISEDFRLPLLRSLLRLPLLPSPAAVDFLRCFAGFAGCRRFSSLLRRLPLLPTPAAVDPLLPSLLRRLRWLP